MKKTKHFLLLKVYLIFVGHFSLFSMTHCYIVLKITNTFYKSFFTTSQDKPPLLSEFEPASEEEIKRVIIASSDSTCLCKCHTRDACRLHAACMQPACSLLHPACRMLQLQPPAYDRMQAAWSLHEVCMQAATSCMQPAATCNLLHTIVFTKSATISTTFRRHRRAGRRRLHSGVDALQISLNSMM